MSDQLRSIVITLHADRHRDDARAFAESVQVDVRDAPLPEVLRSVATAVEGDGLGEHARATITISEPFEAQP